jgi:2-(1,2-epoxy-1,2-dihydrophenyl)acetyl-CoA isomerase
LTDHLFKNNQPEMENPTLVLQDLTDQILTLTLNRPDKLNSITESMSAQLQNALKRAEKSDVRTVLLKANGKAFCAGQDLAEVVQRSEGPQYELSDTVKKSYNPVIRAIRNLEKPVVCAVQGTAAGAGANIAFSCDIVFASDDAFFIQSFSKIGLIPDSGGTWFLPRLAGLARANALYMLDEKLTAGKAVEWGLIYQSVPADKLQEITRETCKKLADMPTKGIGLYKRALNRSLCNTLDDQLEMEAELQAEAGKSEDYHEGINAFLNKCKPKFKGS